MKKANECEMRNAECGINFLQQAGHFAFRIPHFAFIRLLIDVAAG
jgi:hypothetical protein